MTAAISRGTLALGESAFITSQVRSITTILVLALRTASAGFAPKKKPTPLAGAGRAYDYVWAEIDGEILS